MDRYRAVIASLATLTVLAYYVLLCFASVAALARLGEWVAMLVAGLALLARHFLGPLSGRHPAGSHRFVDGMVAIYAVLVNVGVIVVAVVRLAVS